MMEIDSAISYARSLSNDLNAYDSSSQGHFEQREVYGGGHAGASTFKSYENEWVPHPQEMWIPDKSRRKYAERELKTLMAETPYRSVRYFIACRIKVDRSADIQDWLDSLSTIELSEQDLHELRVLYAVSGIKRFPKVRMLLSSWLDSLSSDTPSEMQIGVLRSLYRLPVDTELRIKTGARLGKGKLEVLADELNEGRQLDPENLLCVWNAVTEFQPRHIKSVGRALGFNSMRTRMHIVSSPFLRALRRFFG
jgi:hypothetical protein